MQTKLHRSLIALALLALSTFDSQFSTAKAQGTAFTYQGRLNAGGSPANGSYDMTFSLFGASTGGRQAGNTLTYTAVGVTNGLFTATLDFGAGVFTGANLWLDISVRTNGGGAFSELVPRQPLTPAPYALYSPNAGVAVSAGTANTVAAGSISSASIRPGSIMASNLNLGDVSNGLGGSFWGLGGNAGTGGTAFLGTTDDQPLDLWANNTRVMRLQYASASSPLSLDKRTSANVIGGYNGNSVSAGIVGGTIAGGGQHFVSGTPGGNADSPNSVTANFGTVGGGYGNTAGPDATVPGGYNNIAAGEGSFAAGRNAQTTNSGSFIWSDGSQTVSSSGVNCFDVFATGGVFFHTASAGVNLSNVTISGNLNLPATAVIASGGNSLLEALTIDQASQNIGNLYSNALTFGSYSGEGIASKRSGNNDYDLEFYTDAQNRMTIDHSGNVTVPGSVIAGNVAISGNLSLPATATISSAGNSLFEALTIDQAGKNIGNLYSNALIFGPYSGEGIASKRSGANPYDLEFYTDAQNRMTISQIGNVGIGTTNPAETLEINGTSRIDNNDMYLRAGTDRNHGLGYRATVSAISTDGPFLYGWSGGALGTAGPESIALRWDRQGNTWVSNNVSANAGLAIDQAGQNIGNLYSNALTFGPYSGEGIASKRSGSNPYDLEFYTGAQNRMTIDHSGNVTVPGAVVAGNVNVSGAVTAANVTISGDLSLSAAATISSAGNSLFEALTIDQAGQNIGNLYSNALTFGPYSGEGIASKRSGDNDYDLEFYTGGQNRLTIDHSGNVTVPGAVTAGNVTISGALSLPATASISSRGTSLFEGLNIDQAGKNIGNLYSNALTFGPYSGEGIASKRSGNNDYDLEFYTDAQNRMTIDHTGNVTVPGKVIANNATILSNLGIGTSTPSETLEINGTSRIDDNDMYLRTGTDHNHGLGYRAQVGSTSIDGPLLYGWSGGALGTTGGQGVALQWDDTGSVSVNNNLSINGVLTVPGAGVNTKTTAFIQYTTPANSVKFPPGIVWSRIDNPACNGNPNAILIVTINEYATEHGPLYASQYAGTIVVDYTGGHWYLQDANGNDLAAGLAFNVLVIVP
jgi:hypothetical protein